MPKKIKQASSQPGAPREKHFEFPSLHILAVDPKNFKHLYKINEQQNLCRKRDIILVLTTTREKNARNSKVFKYGKEKCQGTGNKMNCTPWPAHSCSSDKKKKSSWRAVLNQACPKKAIISHLTLFVFFLSRILSTLLNQIFRWCS